MRNRSLRVVLFAGLTYLILFHILLFWRAKDNALSGAADFSAFHSAGRMVRAGLAGQLYDPATQARLQAELFPDPKTRTAPLL
jgi:hypothetical protein